MGLIKPKALKAGGTIGLIAPSSYCAPEDSAYAKRELEKRGYKVFVHPQCHARDHMSAGTPQEKVAALHDVFSDKNIDAVFCLRGGYQTINIIDGIDYDLIAGNPKILMGYSDITALHAALLRRSGLVTFHGPTARMYGELSNPDEDLANKNNLLALDFLNNDIPEDLMHSHAAQVLQQGAAEGVLVGGNMQLLSSMIEAGDQYCPSFDKAILIIEEVSEEITKIERQFSAWRLRGLFKNLAGLIVGHMTDIKDTPGKAGSFVYDMEAVIRRHTYEVPGPVIMNGPFGHEIPNYVFPLGVKARLMAPEKAVPQLQLLESPFADA